MRVKGREHVGGSAEPDSLSAVCCAVVEGTVCGEESGRIRGAREVKRSRPQSEAFLVRVAVSEAIISLLTGMGRARAVSSLQLARSLSNMNMNIRRIARNRCRGECVLAGWMGRV